ncbi:MAG: 30S ribosomal protein S1 [Deltaproteobacteria bacterium]|nr:30S ribosomal protein S1 [Deltaproteobacteria bacterium]
MPNETPTAASGSLSFKDLYEQSLAQQDSIKEGEIVNGTVLRVTKDNVVVDIGFKSEGVIPLSQFIGAVGEITVKAGDKVDVLVESREDENGLVLLSKEKADKMKVWDEISAACDREEVIEGTISQRVKGGLSVTIKGGVKAFLPGSQVDLRPIRNLDKLIGQSYTFKVIKFNKKRGNIVLSRRVLLEREREEMKSVTLKNLSEGMIVKGTIKNITEYGAFVDLGGIDGLLHITDMTYGRLNHPEEMFKMGDEVQVKVLKYNPDTERVSLGLKQTQEDPWTTAQNTYAKGVKVKGKVVSIPNQNYGAFVELEPGVEGLVHISELSWSKRVKHPRDLLKEGDEVECVVIEVDAANRRISLSIKDLEPKPWVLFVNEFNPGDKISGKVRSITDYGIFIGIRDGVDGMVHKSDLSWTLKVNNPSDLYRKNDDVEAIILSINHDEEKVSLGIKQLHDDPWNRIPNDYPPGKEVNGKFLSLFEGGVFVQLDPGVDALIPSHELSPELLEGKKHKRGDAVVAHVANLDLADRRILLTQRAGAVSAPRPVASEPAPAPASTDGAASTGTPKVRHSAAPVATPTASKRAGTLGDLIKEKLGDQLADVVKTEKESK